MGHLCTYSFNRQIFIEYVLYARTGVQVLDMQITGQSLCPCRDYMMVGG